MSRGRRRSAAAALALLLLAACEGKQGGSPARDERPEPPPQAPAAAETAFAETTAAAGLAFRHQSGAAGHRLLPETMGAGLAFFDADGDGDADLFLVQSGTLGAETSGAGAEAGPVGALYRNLGAGRFEEAEAGLAGAGCYGMGAAAGDLDNDGDLDLFVSGVGRQLLFLNRGDGHFAEAGAELGLAARGFGSSAAFLDFDRDGWLDLFAGRYVSWSPASDLPCRPDGVHRAYCTPEVYAGESNLLFRNVPARGVASANAGSEGVGARRLQDVTAAAGVELPEGKTLGVVAADLDGDGWADLAVANDTARNFLFLNRAGAGFREVGVEAGFAYGESGAPRGGMGIDAADVDADGRPDVVVGNFAQEMSAFYRALPAGQEGGLLFVDDAAQVGLGLPTLMTLAFGTLIFDYDGDGWLDLLLANGHIEPEIASFRRAQTHAQPAQLFRNDGRGGFEAVGEGAGDLAHTWVGRGLASADVDGDGDLDVALTENGGPAHLFTNRLGGGSWLRLELVSAAGGASPYGAKVRITAAGRTFERELSGGRSYLSASEPVLTVGLGDARRVDRLEVSWPSGRKLALLRLEVNRGSRLTEPR